MSLKLAAIFKDFMVVQRNRPITVFGTGVPKTVVTVSLHTSFSKTVVAADGTWCATLPPLAAGTDYVLTETSCGRGGLACRRTKQHGTGSAR